MIIVISSNNKDYATIAAEAAKELLSDLNVEIKSIKDLPNYRPNRQLFGGDDNFDNWIINDCQTVEELEPLKKALSIYLSDINSGWVSNDFTAMHKYMVCSEEALISEYLEYILVKEKLMYPKTRKEA